MRLESVPARPAYIDPHTAQAYPLDEPRWRADSGGPLMITPLLGIGRADIDTARRSLWRHVASFPLPIRNPVTMGEGLTPLIERGWRSGRALFKLESFAPARSGRRERPGSIARRQAGRRQSGGSWGAR
jgi:threonine synthase